MVEEELHHALADDEGALVGAAELERARADVDPAWKAVAINSALFTTMRYLLQDTPTIREREFVRTLADMIVGLLEQRGDAADGRRRSRV